VLYLWRICAVSAFDPASTSASIDPALSRSARHAGLLEQIKTERFIAVTVAPDGAHDNFIAVRLTIRMIEAQVL